MNSNIPYRSFEEHWKNRIKYYEENKDKVIEYNK